MAEEAFPHVTLTEQQVLDLFRLPTPGSSRFQLYSYDQSLHLTRIRSLEMMIAFFHVSFPPPADIVATSLLNKLIKELDQANVNSMRNSISWIQAECTREEYRGREYFPLPVHMRPVLSRGYHWIFRQVHNLVNRNLHTDPRSVFPNLDNIANMIPRQTSNITGLRLGMPTGFKMCSRFEGHQELFPPTPYPVQLHYDDYPCALWITTTRRCPTAKPFSTESKTTR